MGDDKKVLTLILAGGKGARLYPLTRDRTKPAVSFAGRYRIIDFVLSNCINSGLRQIYLMTQVKSRALEEHLRAGWSFLNREFNEFIETVPAQQQLSEYWYEGTADAVFQNICLLEEHRPDHVLILSGDHIYNMDYSELIQQHVQMGSDLSVAVLQVDKKDAGQFGVLSMDQNRRIISFMEKPQDISQIPGDGDTCFINMGIYLFKTKALVKALSEDARSYSDHDFGKNIIPNMLSNYNINGFRFEESRFGGYWRDVGSIQSYFQANMDFLNRQKNLDLIREDWPLHTRGEQLLPAFLEGNKTTVANSLIGAGSHLTNCTVRNSILGPNVNVGRGAVIENAIILGNAKICENCVIQNAIFDEEVSVLTNQQVGVDSVQDRRRFLVSDGIAVVPKSYCVGALN
jgi:glucose-1-phosphate adenylyltransferase